MKTRMKTRMKTPTKIPIKIPPTIQSFPELIAYLIKEEHEGVAWDMAAALGVSSGIIYQWRKGLVKRPSDVILHRLAEHYKIDPMAILLLMLRRPIAGGSANDTGPVRGIMSPRLNRSHYILWLLRTCHTMPMAA